MTTATGLLLVTAPDCHLCEHGREVARRLAAEMGVPFSEVSWLEPSGSALVARDGVAFPPALYAGPRLVAYGRLSERRLRRGLLGSAA